MLPAPLLIVAVPVLTTPLTGNAYTCEPNAMNSDTASVFKANPALTEPPPEARLPPFLVFSDTATKVPVLAFQIER